MPARRVELTWPGKETIPEPQPVPLTLREGGSSRSTNRLILGDNLGVMAALLPEFAGRVDLIYADPPFATGTDRGDFADRWPDLPAYLSWILPRLRLMRDLLSPVGSLIVHVDYRVSPHLRLLLDELFGAKGFRNEVVWHYRSGGRPRSHYARKHDTLLWYARGPRPFFDPRGCSVPRSTCSECGQTRSDRNHMARGKDNTGRPYRTIRSNGKLYRYYDDDSVAAPDVWLGISHLQQKDPERTGYATQKPERLLHRIVATHCPADGLAADFFCGSGTTLVVAEKLGRRWLGCDAGERAIETTRRRLLSLPNARPFAVYHAGSPEQVPSCDRAQSS